MKNGININSGDVEWCGDFSCGECRDCDHFKIGWLESEGKSLKKIANDMCGILIGLGHNRAEEFHEKLKKYDHIEGE